MCVDCRPSPGTCGADRKNRRTLWHPDERPSLIVIDEAHHALAETYKELWLHYPNAKKLGMTATPCRMNHKGFTDLFDTLITSDSIADFIRQGWLSVFDYVSIRPDSEDQLLVDSLSKRGADGDFQMICHQHQPRTKHCRLLY